MKVTCNLEQIKEKVQHAERITGKNLSLPILRNVLFRVNEDGIVLRSTNLDMGVEVLVPARVDSDGTVAVSGSILSGVLSALPAKSSVTFEEVNGNLVVSTKGTTTVINGLPADEFPDLPGVEDVKTVSLPVEVFIEGVRNVWYSAAHTDIKPEFSSVYLYFNEGAPVFVSTDSFRLAEKRGSVTTGYDGDGIIIPIKNVNEMVKILSSQKGEMKIEYDQNQLVCTLGGVLIVSRLVNGVYPDYRQIIPSEFTTEVTVLKDVMLGALKLTNILTDKFHKMSLTVRSKEGKVDVSSKSSGVGENMSSFDAKVVGDDFTAHFNYRYILDGFQSISGDRVLFRYDAKRDVLVMSGVGDPTFTYLVKPMNK